MAKAVETDQRRYAPIGRYLRDVPPDQSAVSLSFDKIEEIIEAPLPPSAIKHREWWANQSAGSRAPHWDAAGFKVASVDAGKRIVRFVRKAKVARPPRALSLQEVITEVNDAARTHAIGTLQEWRKGRHGSARPPSATLFYAGVDKDRKWAFHAGGLVELQFNVGFEDIEGVQTFRHGVAFSLQPTREMPEIDPLVPKIARFNEFVRIYPDAFDGFVMWHWSEETGRSANYPVAPIPDEQVVRGSFIFIGVLQPEDEIEIDWIVEDFDRLLPLYQYVEGTEADAFPKIVRGRKGFVWSPGNKAKKSRTMYQHKAKTVDKSLRHNIVQDALFKHLEKIHGKDDTSGEQDCGNGTPVDVAVKDGDSYVYYELKTGLSAQSCIREAFGQLMEYSFWPGAQEATRLIVVGEAEYDKDAKAYIKKLRKEFRLPIEYQQFDMKSGRLV